MSWLFSQALAEEYSAGTSLDGERFAQLNVMPTPHKFWRNDKTMEHSDLYRFGLMCAVLKESSGAELLTSFLAAFPVKTFPEPAKALVSKKNGQVFGSKWQESSVRFDPQYVLLENSPLLMGRGLAVVLGDLATLGFDAEWCCVSASECGATHNRYRIWLSAYPSGEHGQSWNSVVQSQNGGSPLQSGRLFGMASSASWR